MTAFPAGFLVLDKPSGVTSFAMVSLVRRLTGVRRVGHAGTLDPLASGVLPVAVGPAARFIEYLDDARKVYIATVVLGTETDTYDADGVVMRTADASVITREAVAAALSGFIGEIEQVPPAHSAIKVAGKPLYRYVREGVALNVPARRVRIDSIELISFEDGASPPLALEVTCGKGTYIRSLAHDLGRKLGCGAHLTALRRTSSGGFTIKAAHTPEMLVALRGAGELESALLHVDRAVERRPAAILDEPRVRDVLAGRDFAFADSTPHAPAAAHTICRAYSTNGRFLGVVEARADGRWHPVKVVADV